MRQTRAQASRESTCGSCASCAVSRLAATAPYMARRTRRRAACPERLAASRLPSHRLGLARLDSHAVATRTRASPPPLPGGWVCRGRGGGGGGGGGGRLAIGRGAWCVAPVRLCLSTPTHAAAVGGGRDRPRSRHSVLQMRARRGRECESALRSSSATARAQRAVDAPKREGGRGRRGGSATDARPGAGQVGQPHPFFLHCPFVQRSLGSTLPHWHCMLSAGPCPSGGPNAS